MKQLASVTLFLLVMGLLAGCQPVPPASIKAQMSAAGPPIVEQFTEAGEECLLHVTLPWKLEGNLQGAAEIDYRIVIQHACDATPPGTYDEDLYFTGNFKGKLDGREGTFDFFGVAKSVKGEYAARWAIVPDSGTGGLAGLTGMIALDGKMLGPAGTYSVSGDYSLPPASR